MSKRPHIFRELKVIGAVGIHPFGVQHSFVELVLAAFFRREHSVGS